MNQQYAGNVIDGVVLGDGIYKNRADKYAQDPTRTFNELQNRKNMPFEWATYGQTNGAWVQLYRATALSCLLILTTYIVFILKKVKAGSARRGL